MSYYVYIVTNPGHTVLYIGVSNNLRQRIQQHYENRGKPQTFAGRYSCYNLIYYEAHEDITAAIAREKQLKGWTRAKKEVLIATMNPEWRTHNYNV